MHALTDGAICPILNSYATDTMTALQTQGLMNGFAVVDMGKAGQQAQGFRFLVKRTADQAIWHLNTAKEVRELF